MLKRMEKKLRNKKGFSLVELIVVIAIIGILVMLAAPKFMGYTRDAEVAAMKADVKILSDAAMLHDLDKNFFPTVGATEALPNGTEAASTTNDYGIVESVKTAEFDKDMLKDYVKNIKGDLSDYVLVVSEGDHVGEAVAKAGVKDKAGNTHFGMDIKVAK